MGNVLAIVKVTGSEPRGYGENHSENERLVQYSSERYPLPKDFAAELRKSCTDYIRKDPHAFGGKAKSVSVEISDGSVSTYAKVLELARVKGVEVVKTFEIFITYEERKRLIS